MVAPFIGPVNAFGINLPSGQIEQVIAGGENYDGSRPLDFAWVKIFMTNVSPLTPLFVLLKPVPALLKTAEFTVSPTKAYKAGRLSSPVFSIRENRRTSKLAPPVQSALFGNPEVYRKSFRRRCDSCGSRLICNGCSDCGRCAD